MQPHPDSRSACVQYSGMPWHTSASAMGKERFLQSLTLGTWQRTSTKGSSGCANLQSQVQAGIHKHAEVYANVQSMSRPLNCLTPLEALWSLHCIWGQPWLLKERDWFTLHLQWLRQSNVLSQFHNCLQLAILLWGLCLWSSDCMMRLWSHDWNRKSFDRMIETPQKPWSVPAVCIIWLVHWARYAPLLRQDGRVV